MMQKHSSLVSLRRNHKKLLHDIIISAIILLIVIFTIRICVKLHTSTNQPDQTGDHQNSSESTTAEPTYIDLQAVVDAWYAKYPNIQVGLEIYDLDFQKIAASLNANQVFNIASIYKLFYAYVGYEKIDQGAYFNKKYITNDYRADTYSFSECLDLMIRESYNGCADQIRTDQTLSRDVANLIQELGLTNTTNYGLSSTASDLTDFLKFLYFESTLSETSKNQFLDSMLNQPPTLVAFSTIYDWRQGLPTGFSDDVLVYNKVGWAWQGEYWTTYADAAILDFTTENRHYAIAVLTSGIDTETPKPIIELGQIIEAAIRK